MDSQYSTAAINELMSVVRQLQQKKAARAGNPLFVAIHFVFGGLAVVTFCVVVLCRLAGYQIGDELTDKYVFSLATSVLFFAVGTLMIERLPGDVFGGFLGRALAGCGLFVMSAQGYEFMQKTRACEVQHELLAREKARPVSETTFVALRSAILKNGLTVEWESDSDGRTRPVSIANRCSAASGDRVECGVADIYRQSRSVDPMPRGESRRATSTNGDAETF